MGLGGRTCVLVVIAACGGGGADSVDGGGGADGRVGPDAAAIDAAAIDAAAIDAAATDGAPGGPDAGGSGAFALDPSFGTGGLATAAQGFSADRGHAVAVQSDGKVVLAGTSQAYEDQLGQFTGELLVVRLTATGALDTSFAGDGIALVPVGTRAIARAVAVQPDGAIVVAGYTFNPLTSSRAVLVRLTADGALDPSFGDGGVVTMTTRSELYAIALQPDGAIVVAGVYVDAAPAKLLVARYTAAGALDGSFGTGGVAATAIGSGALAFGVAVDGDGTIVAAGYTEAATRDLAVVRLLSDGAPDTAFGNEGVVTTAVGSFGDEARAVALPGDGKVIVAGIAYVASAGDGASVVLRYEADGDPDPTFSGDGVAITDATAFVDGFSSLGLLAGGGVIAGGDRGGAAFDIVQFAADGSIALSFEPDLDDGAIEAIAFAADGASVVAGKRFGATGDIGELVAARLSAAGAQDASFGAGGVAAVTSGATGEIATGVVVQPDGKVVSAGGGVRLTQRRAALARHTADGALDPTFGTGGVAVVDALATARGLERAADGKLLVAGDAALAVGWRFTVARYDDTGALDDSFATAGVFTDPIIPGGNGFPKAMTLDAAGNVVVVGAASPSFSSTDAAVLRLLPDGTPDPAFSGDGRVVTDLGSSFDNLFAVAAGPGDTIVVAGYADALTVVRYENDGALDATFGTGGIATPSVPGMLLDALLVTAGGDVLLAGYRQFPPAVLIARLTPTGSLDGTFGTAGIVTYPLGGDAPVLYGNRFEGPALLPAAGGHTLVALTDTADLDESIRLVWLDADGAVADTVTAAGPGYWTAFDVAPAPGGALVVAGRGFSATGGTDFGLARFVPSE